MKEPDHHWGITNPGPDRLLVWLEPWADEFDVPIRSTLTMKASGESEPDRLGEIEWSEDYLVVWASTRTVEVFIDGVLQRSGSAIIPVPDGLTRKMLNVVFAGHPAARLGGASAQGPHQKAWWKLMWRRLGI